MNLQNRKVENQSKTNPLDVLIKVKLALISELKLELLQPGISSKVKRMIKERIQKTDQQIIQIIKLIESLENQLPPPAAKVEAKIETVSPTNEKTSLNSKYIGTILLSLGIGLNANYFIQNFQKVDNQNQLKTAVLTAPVNVTPVEIPKPISFDLDASNGFESAGFKPTAAYLSNITRELKNKISSSTKSITISVFSSMRPDSPHTSQNYQFHENLTKNRAEAIVRALKQNSDFQFIQFIAVGMGAAEDNLGKKVNFLISAK